MIVGESVYGREVLVANERNPSEIVAGTLAESTEQFHFDAMPNEHRRRVRIAVVCPHRKIVNIVKADIVDLVLQNLEANVSHQAAIERQARGLLHYQYAKRDVPVRPVASKIGMHVRDKGRQMIRPVTIRNNNPKSFHVLLTRWLLEAFDQSGVDQTAIESARLSRRCSCRTARCTGSGLSHTTDCCELRADVRKSLQEKSRCIRIDYHDVHKRHGQIGRSTERLMMPSSL